MTWDSVCGALTSLSSGHHQLESAAFSVAHGLSKKSGVWLASGVAPRSCHWLCCLRLASSFRHRVPLKLGLVTTLPLTLRVLCWDNGDNDAGLVYEEQRFTIYNVSIDELDIINFFLLLHAKSCNRWTSIIWQIIYLTFPSSIITQLIRFFL